jgi:hypothetical protein
VETVPDLPDLSSRADDNSLPVSSEPLFVRVPVVEPVIDVDATSEQPLDMQCSSSAHGSSATPPDPICQTPTSSSQVWFRLFYEKLIRFVFFMHPRVDKNG